MDLGQRDKSTRAMPALDYALLRQIGKRVARSHQADAMDPSQFPLRIDDIARPELAGVDSLTNRALNPLVCRFVLTVALGHVCFVRNVT